MKIIKRLLGLYRRLFWSCEKYAKFEGVKIGRNCHIATKNFGTEPYLIEIGDHVQVTNDVKFFNHSGGWIFRKEYPDLDVFGKIRIKNNVYIGNNVLIMPGVTIGENVMIGAGAVVTKSIPDGSIAAGNPARIIGTSQEYIDKIQRFNVGSKGMSYEKKKSFLVHLEEENFLNK